MGGLLLLSPSSPPLPPQRATHPLYPFRPSPLFFSPTDRAHSNEARRDLFFCCCPAIMTHSQRNNRQGAKSLMAILNSSGAQKNTVPTERHDSIKYENWLLWLIDSSLSPTWTTRVKLNINLISSLRTFVCLRTEKFFGEKAVKMYTLEMNRNSLTFKIYMIKIWISCSLVCT